MDFKKQMENPLVSAAVDQLFDSSLSVRDKAETLARSAAVITLTDIELTTRRLRKERSEIEAIFAAGVVAGATQIMMAKGVKHE